MTAYQKAKLLMAKGLSTFLDENTAIFATVAAFQTALTALKEKIAAIDETAELSSLSIAGITADKRNFKENLCQLTTDIAGMIYAFAVEASNNALKQEVNLSVSVLKRKSDSELLQTCQAIHERGAENATALKNYGITPDLLTELQDAVTAFAAASPKPRTAIGKRKTRREIVNGLFKEMDGILNERMDTLMGKFRTTNPEFYQTYFNLREIVDPSSTTTQLKGTITDAADNKPIKNASVEIVQLAKTTKTESVGEYTFKPVQHGKFTVKITAEGYQPYENEEIVVMMGDIRHLDVSLVIK